MTSMTNLMHRTGRSLLAVAAAALLVGWAGPAYACPGPHAKDQHAAEQPANDQSTKDQPAADQPANEQPAKDQPASGQPASDQQVSGQPAGQQAPAGSPFGGTDSAAPFQSSPSGGAIGLPQGAPSAG